MKLRAGVTTDRGRVRSLNEDAYVCRGDEGLFVVCDGMGGAPAGEIASQLGSRDDSGAADARRLVRDRNSCEASDEASDPFGSPPKL